MKKQNYVGNQNEQKVLTPYKANNKESFISFLSSFLPLSFIHTNIYRKAQ